VRVSIEAITSHVIAVVFIIFLAATHHSITTISPPAAILVTAISIRSIFILIPRSSARVAVSHVVVTVFAATHAPL
jgi:hypothetical protein